MDTTNRNTALASALAEELGRCGVRQAVIAPGSRSTPLALALWREPAIDARVVVDERSAGFFAIGAAQAVGSPAAVLTTSGTAAANLHPAVCEADEGGVPMIVLTSDRPPELRAIGAGQTIDQLKLYGDAVRWFCEVGTHEADDAGLLHLRSTACRAFAAAAGDPRPGPVHLNVAWRDPLGPEPGPGEVTARSTLALEGRGDRPLTSVEAAEPVLDEPQVAALRERLEGVERGLIVAGRQPDPGLALAVDVLSLHTGFPVLAEPTSQLRFGRHGEFVVWAYDAIARVAAPQLDPRLVIRFGEMPTSKALRAWLASLEDCDQIVVDDRFGWNEPTRRAAMVVRAAPAATAMALALAGEREGESQIAIGLPAGRGQEDPPTEWHDAWQLANDAAAETIRAELERLGEPTEPGVHATLGRLYADGDLVYTASSMPIRDQEAFLAPRSADVRFLCNRGANGIDGLISSGIGAAAASGRPTWIVTGDLGLFHDMNGLASVREAAGPVRLVVLNNDGGGIFEFLPQAGQLEREEFEALFGTPLGIDLERVAALHDLPYARVERLDQLEGAASLGTALIEVPVDRRRNVEVHRAISATAAAAVERALGGR